MNDLGLITLPVYLAALAGVSAFAIRRLGTATLHGRAVLVLFVASVLSAVFGLLTWSITGRLELTTAFFLLSIVTSLWALILVLLLRTQRL